MLILDKIARTNAQRYAQRIADLDITPRHVGALTAAAHLHAPSQADIGAWLGIGPSAVVAIIDELEARGAVRRHPDTTNRRKQIIELTDEGTRLITQATHRARELDRELLSQLPADIATAFETATHMIATQLGLTGSPP
jgi:DNA-binding MarR family transcriptional regulator